MTALLENINHVSSYKSELCVSLVLFDYHYYCLTIKAISYLRYIQAFVKLLTYVNTNNTRPKVHSSCNFHCSCVLKYLINATFNIVRYIKDIASV